MAEYDAEFFDTITLGPIIADIRSIIINLGAACRHPPVSQSVANGIISNQKGLQKHLQRLLEELNLADERQFHVNAAHVHQLRTFITDVISASEQADEILRTSGFKTKITFDVNNYGLPDTIGSVHFIRQQPSVSESGESAQLDPEPAAVVDSANPQPTVTQHDDPATATASMSANATDVNPTSITEKNVRLHLGLLRTAMANGRIGSKALSRLEQAQQQLEQHIEQSVLTDEEAVRLYALVDEADFCLQEAKRPQPIAASTSRASSVQPQADLTAPATRPILLSTQTGQTLIEYDPNLVAEPTHPELNPHSASFHPDRSFPAPTRITFAPSTIAPNAAPTSTAPSMEQVLTAIFSRDMESKIPEFSGKHDEFRPWLRAIEPIRNCPVRSAIVKFNLIRGSLRGDAVSVVRHISAAVDDHCVEQLIRALTAEYDNPRRLVQAQYAKLASMPSLNTYTYTAFRDWINTLKGIISTLQIAIPGSQPGTEPSFFYQVAAKVPLAIAQRWRLWVRSRGKTPDTTDALITYLEEQLEAQRESLPHLAIRPDNRNDRRPFSTQPGATTTPAAATERPPFNRALNNFSTQLDDSNTPVETQPAETLLYASRAPAQQRYQPPAQRFEQPSSRFDAPQQRADPRPQRYDQSRQHPEFRPNQPTNQHVAQTDSGRRSHNCMKCRRDNHEMADCRNFKALGPNDRLKLAYKLKVHLRCLKLHRFGECRIPDRQQQCPVDANCPHRHHPLLHGAEVSANGANNYTAFSANSGSHHLELLKVFVRGPNGKTFETTAMIDSGACRTVADAKFAEALGAQPNAVFVSLQGIHGAKETPMGTVSFDIRGIESPEWHSVSKAGTIPSICIAGNPVAWKDWAQNQPQFHRLPLQNLEYSDVRIILGQDVKRLTKPLASAIVSSSDELYTAYKSRLGWTISGPRADTNDHPLYYCFLATEEPRQLQKLADEFRRFNDIEALGVTLKASALSRREQADLEFLSLNTTELPSGRLQLPMLINGTGPLPASESQARRRLTLLHKRLDNDQHLRQLYANGIILDERKGYIRKLSSTEAAALRMRIHNFIPHFPVFHPDKPEKCRRVLDAAAKNSGVSLNSRLNTGPNLLNTLVGIILRFRVGKFAINADIVEMFSQIIVPTAQQDLLAFLWSAEPTAEPNVYVNTRHIFGARCSPAIANFAVRQAARKGGQDIHNIVASSFYMDDFYYSSDDEQQVITTAQSVASTLAAAGFHLEKWMSNSTRILEAWPQQLRATAAKEFVDNPNNPHQTIKALGITWDVHQDSLTFATRQQPHAVANVTEVLSMLASTFDPPGLIAPFVLKGKLIFQRLWLSVQDWKKALTPTQQTAWAEWADQLPIAAKLSIPRPYGIDPTKPVTLHAFADASSTAFGTVAYFVQDTIRTFTLAKSRVSNPRKATTIPRLELEAFVCATRLLDNIYAELKDKYNIVHIFIWSDSVIVLFWIRNDETRYHVFVANRLHEIHEFSRLQKQRQVELSIRHVPTAENPADLVSRGLAASELTEQFDFWSRGPAFLENEANFPEDKVPQPSEEPEVRRQDTINLAWNDDVAEFETLHEYYLAKSSQQQLQPGDHLAIELDLLQQVQADEFTTEINTCRRSPSRSYIPTAGPMQRRQIFLDAQNLLRTATRLQNAEFLDDSAKNPIVLPAKHPFTRLVIRSAHVDVGHQGLNHTRAHLFHRFYIPAVTSAIKTTLYACKVCRARKPILVDVPTAPLHSNRFLVNAAPFQDCGMDHFGPCLIARGIKRWGLLFFCRTTRAMHIEAVRSTDKSGLILALARFTARRGTPTRIRSDQGSSFVSLATEQDLSPAAYAAHLEQAVANSPALATIDFRFNPAGAPHWGGDWERAIKEVKKVLVASVSSVAHLSDEAFATALITTEGILNRRPIAFDDTGKPLRPWDILTPAAKETGGFPLHLTTLQQVRQVRQAVQNFWAQWNAAYLTTLGVDKLCGRNRALHLQPGDIVLLKDGNSPIVDHWAPARIIEVHTSADGYIRSALVETETGARKIQDARRLAVTEGAALFRTRQPTVPTKAAQRPLSQSSMSSPVDMQSQPGAPTHAPSAAQRPPSQSSTSSPVDMQSQPSIPTQTTAQRSLSQDFSSPPVNMPSHQANQTSAQRPLSQDIIRPPVGMPSQPNPQSVAQRSLSQDLYPPVSMPLHRFQTSAQRPPLQGSLRPPVDMPTHRPVTRSQSRHQPTTTADLQI